MHKYLHHIGDFMRDTAHLSPVEECFYRRAIDWYYVNEKPLPLDLDQVHRFLRAKTKTDRQAIETVLSDFFQKTASGFQHSRCEIELEKFRSKADANRQNGKTGGRPRKNSNLENHDGYDSVSDGLISETRRNLNHKPLTNNHKPITDIYSADESAPQIPKPKRVTKKQLAIESLIKLGVDEKCAASVIEKRKGSAFSDLAIDEIKLQAELVNLSFAQAIEFAARQDWGSFRADWYQNRVKQQGYQSAQQPNSNQNSWSEYNQQFANDLYSQDNTELVDVSPKKSLLIEGVGHA